MSPVDVSGLASVGYVNFLFGLFLAYWAGQSGRSRLLWFVFGWLLAPVAGLVMLWKSRPPSQAPATTSNDAGRPDLIATRRDVI